MADLPRYQENDARLGARPPHPHEIPAAGCLDWFHASVPLSQSAPNRQDSLLFVMESPSIRTVPAYTILTESLRSQDLEEAVPPLGACAGSESLMKTTVTAQDIASTSRQSALVTFPRLAPKPDQWAPPPQVHHQRHKRAAIACDHCRARKMKCKVAQIPKDESCQACTGNNQPCVFSKPSMAASSTPRAVRKVRRPWRGKKACEQCRKSKIYCDASLPSSEVKQCTGCTKSNLTCSKALRNDESSDANESVSEGSDSEVGSTGVVSTFYTSPEDIMRELPFDMDRILWA